MTTNTFSIAFAAILALTIPWPAPAGEIALTFDDAPRPDTAVFTSAERNRRILEHLERHGAKAMFFVTTRHITEATAPRLEEYRVAGHRIGNHSHAHRSANRIDPDAYLADVRAAHETLSAYPHYRPLYRFPMLHEGGTVETRDAIRDGLRELGLGHGYVTVDNYDWYLDRLLQEAAEAGSEIRQDAWREIYLEHVLASVEFYDGIARRHLSRSPRHVLLLHENDLAALFLGNLIDALKAGGWKIISPGLAYEDPLADRLPDTLFNNQGRVAALAAEKGVERRRLVQAAEDEDYLRERLEARGLMP